MEDLLQGNKKDQVGFVEVKDAEKWIHDGCPYCQKKYDFAKKHELRVIGNKYTQDIIGVEIK